MLSHPAWCWPTYLQSHNACWSSKEWLRRGHPPNSRRVIPLRSQKRKDRFLPVNNCDDNKQQSCESLVAAIQREERRSEKAAQEVWLGWGIRGKISKTLIWFPGAYNGATGIWLHTKPPRGPEGTPPWHSSEASQKKPLLPTSTASVLPQQLPWGSWTSLAWLTRRRHSAWANSPEALLGVI